MGCLSRTVPSVLHPFSGRATTAAVAAFLGRRGIGIDLSTDYFPVVQVRVRGVHERYAQMVVDEQMSEVGVFID
jgi:DNA modification methylase